MLFVVGGVPRPLHERFQQLAKRTFGTGDRLISKPLTARSDGKYVLRREDGIALIEELAKRAVNDKSLFTDGCGIVALSSQGTTVDEFVELFSPFSIVRRIDLPAPTLVSGERGQQTANRIAKSISTEIKELRQAVRAMASELSSRLNRTPLLLPTRNFHSKVLNEEIVGLFKQLPYSSQPHNLIAAACKRIEVEHPFVRERGSSFHDSKGTRFRLPGRAKHGRPWSIDPPHLVTCLLNGLIRLGGTYNPGFHYDCTKGLDGALRGEFQNCHSAVEQLNGDPHINISPNDFLRV